MNILCHRSCALTALLISTICLIHAGCGQSTNEHSSATTSESDFANRDLPAGGFPPSQTPPQGASAFDAFTSRPADSEAPATESRGSGTARMTPGGSGIDRIHTEGGRSGDGFAEGAGTVQTDPLNSAARVLSAARAQREGVRRTTFELLPGEELWVITRKAEPTPPVVEVDQPRCGCLMANVSETEREVPVPLRHTAVNGTIDGYIATVDVTQQFHNPWSTKIEAVYVFPLPDNAAVSEFVMTVGERRIRGIIREREEAQQIYQQAKSQGHVASLLTQERPNIFTQKVANIEPGKQIDINLRYFHTLQYDDGAYEFVFPMVVGPRYNPPVTGDGIGAVPRAHHGASGQSTEIQYLTPGERSGHDVAVTLQIAAGVEIESIRSLNHQTDVRHTSETSCSVVLSAADTIPNKDFVLRYHVAGEQIRTAMMTQRDERGQYFTMMLYPPAELSHVPRSAMEMVFVLDCSGSMSGRPIEQARTAIAQTLQTLTPRDTFQIINFSSTASALGPAPINATPENLRRGLQYLGTLDGSGGTEMINGIRAALDFPHDEGRFRVVSFMTDGFIGNEYEILNAVAEKLGDSRIFSFGVGQSPNRFLMDRMAVLGRGAVAYLNLTDDPAGVMNRFNERISHPAMTDLSIDWGTMQVTDVYPQVLPDLVVGRPVVVTGRYTGLPGVVTISGLQGSQPISSVVSLRSEDATREHKGIASVWARLKIKDLMNQAAARPTMAADLRSAVTQTALDYSLMSEFTSFVAVDSLSRTVGGFGTTVAVPVNVPEGVRYDTAVPN